MSMGTPPVSKGLQLLRDLAEGKASFDDVHRFYEAAADVSERNPEAAAVIERVGESALER